MGLCEGPYREAWIPSIESLESVFLDSREAGGWLACAIPGHMSEEDILEYHKHLRNVYQINSKVSNSPLYHEGFQQPGSWKMRKMSMATL